MMKLLVTTIAIFITVSTAYGKLDVGEPRTVGLVYALPHDREYNQEIVDRLKSDIVSSQHFFASELERHGYGYREFNVELDGNGEPLVHFIQMQKGDRLIRILSESFNFVGNIFVIVYDEGIAKRGIAVTWRYPQEPQKMSDEGGYVLLGSTYGHKKLRHELGHVFRLEHDFKNNHSIMSWTAHGERGINNALLECQAAALAMHPYFNHSIPLEDTMIYYAEVPWVKEGEELVLPTIDGINVELPDTYTHADESIPITVEVNNPNGVYYVSLIGGRIVFNECRYGTGGVNETFRFDYNGYQDHDRFYTLGSREYHILALNVIDMLGNLYTVHAISYRDDTIKREDVNADGAVNVLDLVTIANHISNGTFDAAADVNGDGVVNILDLVSVSQALQ